MRSSIIALAAAIAVVAGVSLVPGQPAFAQETAAKDVPIVIGTLDVPTLLTQSKAGKSLVAELKKRRKATSETIGKKEQTLRAKQQKLDQGRSAMPQPEFEKQVAALQKEFDALRKEANAERKKIDQAQDAGFEQIRKALDVVIRDIADKRGLTLIINRSAVVLGADDWDITGDVKKALDAKLSAVKL